MTNTYPTLGALASSLVYIAPTSDETADEARARAERIRENDGQSWAYFGTRNVRVYDLGFLGLSGNAWNGLVAAVSDEVFASEHGLPVEYRADASPATPGSEVAALIYAKSNSAAVEHEFVDFDTYSVDGGTLLIGYRGGADRTVTRMHLGDRAAHGLVRELVGTLALRGDATALALEAVLDAIDAATEQRATAAAGA